MRWTLLSPFRLRISSRISARGASSGQKRTIAYSLWYGPSVTAESGLYDVVLRGHTHVADVRTIGKTLVVNVGSLVGPFQNRGWTAPSAAVLDTESLAVQMIDV